MYFLIFIISAALLYAAENRIIVPSNRWLARFIALMLPCLIAGIRSADIGTDVNVYVRPLAELALDAPTFQHYYESKFWASWHKLGPSDYEVGFSILIWIFARLTRSISGVLFGVQALTIVPCYFAAKKYLSDKGVWLAMAVYYLMFYNISLNLMRQMIAIAMVLLAYSYLTDKKRGMYLCFVVVAVLMHKTAIMAIMLAPALSIVRRISDRNQLAFMVLALSCIALMAVGPVGHLMDLLGLDQYAAYLMGNKMEMSWSQFLSKTGLLLLVMMGCGAVSVKSMDDGAFLLLLCILSSVVLSPIGSLSQHASRILLYLDQFAVLLVPSVYLKIDRCRARRIYLMAVILYLVVYWLMMFVILEVGETTPYAVWGA